MGTQGCTGTRDMSAALGVPTAQRFLPSCPKSQRRGLPKAARGVTAM